MPSMKGMGKTVASGNTPFLCRSKDHIMMPDMTPMKKKMTITLSTDSVKSASKAAVSTSGSGGDSRMRRPRGAL